MAKAKNNKNLLTVQKILLLVALIALFIAIFLYKAPVTNSDDRIGFNNLSKELKSLQTDLNKIHSGWVYSEGCSGKGGVYEQDKASSCSITLINKSSDAKEIKSKFLMYSDSIDDVFLVITPSTESRWSISNSSDNRFYKSAGYKYDKFPGTSCNLREFFDEVSVDSQSGGVNFTCTHSTEQFYFRRSDI